MKNPKRVLSLSLALTLSLGLSVPALAAEEPPERGVLTYTQAIAPQYEAAQSFSEDLAAVKKDGKWGYIDKTGAVVIPFQYDRAYEFNEGYAIVGNLLSAEEDWDWVWNAETQDNERVPNGSYRYTYELGFIDKAGNLTWFEETYYDWEDDTEKTGHYQISFNNPDDYKSYDLVFHNGYLMRSSNYEPVGLLFDTTGKDVTESIPYDGWYYPYDFQVTEGMVIYGAYDLYGGDQFYVNVATGERIQVSPSIEGENYGFTWVILRPFNQGMAPAASAAEYYDDEAEKYMTTQLWGFVDKQGQWVIQPQYTDFVVNGMTTSYKVFGETGLAMVADNNDKWGGIDKAGNTVIPFEYDWLWPYYFGLCAFQKDGKWGFLDKQGNVALPAQYENTSGFSSGGYAVVYDGVNAYLIDSKGNPVPGADNLDPNAYFKTNEDGSKSCYTPSEYVVTQENGLYGFGHIEYKPPLPQAEEVSSWAYEEVTAAIEEDLVPNYLQNLFQQNITRDEFCDLIVQAVEEITDKSIDDVVLEKTGKSLDSWRHEYPFKDTTSSNVIAANALGIVNGRGDGNFDPYATITRQEAAALLMRGAAVLGLDTTNIQNAGFADSGEVGEWFTAAVNFVNQISVMGGTGDNKFTPLGSYSREQSFMTMYRLFLNIIGK